MPRGWVRIVPPDHTAFAAMIADRFPPSELAGVTIRTIARPGTAPVTLVYISALIDASDLTELVLAPITRGLPDLPPEELVQQGSFPAPVQRVVQSAGALQEGLCAGLAAVHVAGCSQALLVGGGRAEQPPGSFGPALAANVDILHRHLALPDLCAETITGPQGKRFALVYLRGKAPDRMLAAVRRSLQTKGGPQPKTVWWKTAAEWLRIPPLVGTDSPAEAAGALRQGYVAVLEAEPGAVRLGPLTLDLLLAAPGDQTLAPAFRRLVRWPRLLGAVGGLLISSFFVASASYHHSLLPGPFLVALASSRQNPALPIVMEILLVELLGDAIRTGTRRLGGRHFALLSFIGTVLAITLAVQAGLLGAVSGVVGAASVTIREILPNRTLRRAVRIWRYLFIAAAAGLGMYGVSLLWFATIHYLQEERAFGHSIRRPLEVRS